ncbi:glutathione S-transferase C-terminal-like protein [Hygrophoropsis aurantiaca]|uniref:Glutathione S-transferase C-terminal-like protein n=1 Tax=Hygrophoropsis aurantiaca TaxID=72124 RepID=A0ACB8AHP3_9AGAM|nr:glutathione S-transferase C-terminal-like protein [Hygrophoropsis aurantiaca]
MANIQQITLYTAKICPYAHRVEIALNEAKASFKSFQIDLQNKPEWYAPKVNPASKVPAIAYGGPDVPPETPSPDSTKLAESLPSPDSTKLAESLVLVEFVADLFPQSSILPTDPVLRAQARFFIEAISTKFTPSYGGFVLRGDSYENVLQGIDAIQPLLPEPGKFAVGDQFSVADIAIAPFIARLFLAAQHDIGKYEAGDGHKLLSALAAPKFAKFNAYKTLVLERPSVIATFDNVGFKLFVPI